MADFVVDSIIRKLIGLPCWYVAAGGCTGSVFNLYLGAMIPRDKPVKNVMLGEQARLNAPEYGLMAYCAWRLDGPAGPITGWLDPNEIDGPMVVGLEGLVGEKILNANLSRPSWDLEVVFTGGKTLKVFCDATESTVRSSNWILFGPNGSCLTSKRGVLVVNPG